MVSNAVDFFTAIVVPTVSEFTAAPYDVRRVRLAAIVLYHLADYVAFEEKEQIANLHLKLIASCQDFLIVRDVADATKHANLNPAKKIARQLSSSAQVDAPPGLFQVPFGEAYFREAIEVYVTLDSGEVKSLVPIIGSVLEMWRRRLSELSVGAFSGA